MEPAEQSNHGVHAEPPLRIAIVTDNFYPHLGGISEHVHHLALELQHRGHDVTVVSARMRGRYPEAFRHQYPVRRVGRSVVVYANGGQARITVGWGLRQQLEAVFRDGRFDVIHVHGGLAPTFGTLTPLAAQRVGIPVVATFHSWFPRSVGYRVFQQGFRRVLELQAANIAVSQPVVEAHSRYFTTDWEIIPNGVDVAYFHPDGRRPTAAVSGTLRLLYLHRLEPRNHLGTLLAAMPEILRHCPQAELIVAGDGPWRRYYQRSARRLGPSVQFLGRIEDRPDRYRGADLFLCPTTRAGFGITLLEAMACGTPLVVADNPAFRAVAGGGVAVLLPYDDPGAWAEAVVALARDPGRRREMSELGIGRVAAYAWPQVADRILAVYRRVLR